MVGENRTTLWGLMLRIPFLLLAFTTAIPYYWMMINAFKPVTEIVRNPPIFYIQEFTTTSFWDPACKFLGDSYSCPDTHVPGLFQRFISVPLRFGTFFLNSLFVSTTITILKLLLASLAAYVLCKHQFPGRNVIFLIVLASFMVPWQVGFIPNFITVFKLGWLNTYTAFIIPAIPNAFSVFFLRQYMQTLPDELLDAARIDGANEWRIWLQIILPQVGPALAALTIYSVLNEWNNFVWPLIVAQTPNMQTLPVALSTLNSVASGPRNMGVFMVASLLTSIPAVTIFLAFQRQFIQSIARSGIKG